MAVVSDSSPLILYSAIRRLDLLHAIFDEVVVPAAVYAEVVTGGGGRPGAPEVPGTAWISRRPLVNSRLISPLLATLGLGEAEAIGLALELGGGIPVLMDDSAGRHIARARGLRVLGSAGVLVEAKTTGLIVRVRPVLDELRTAGLWLGAGAYRTLLALAQE
ncbi:MAG TPA: DUF3368 domain-containing protein [Chloroflexota bacterium]|nr:DUF3368 domain-containing protein [Chloroflexota bacterium]